MNSFTAVLLCSLALAALAAAGTEEPGRTPSGAVSTVPHPWSVDGVTGGVMRSGVEQGTYFATTWKFWQKGMIRRTAAMQFEETTPTLSMVSRELVGNGLHQTLKTRWEIARPFAGTGLEAKGSSRECYLFLGSTVPQQAYVSIYELAQLERSAINNGKHGLGLWTFEEMDLEAFANPDVTDSFYFIPTMVPFNMTNEGFYGKTTVDVELPVHFRYWPPVEASDHPFGTVTLRAPRFGAVACPETIEAGLGHSVLPEEWLADGVDSSSEGTLLLSNFVGRSSDIEDYDNFDDRSTVQLNVTRLNHPMMAYRGWHLLAPGYKGDLRMNRGSVHTEIPRGQLKDNDMVVNVTLGATLMGTVWLLYAAFATSDKPAGKSVDTTRKSGRKPGAKGGKKKAKTE